jgi:hypothetical protein
MEVLPMSKQRKRVSFEERMVLVWEQIFAAAHPLTQKEISEACHMARSPYLVSILVYLKHYHYIDAQPRFDGTRYKGVEYYAVCDPLPLIQAINIAVEKKTGIEIPYGDGFQEEF